MVTYNWHLVFSLCDFIAECIWIGFILLVLGTSSTLTWLLIIGLPEITFVLSFWTPTKLKFIIIYVIVCAKISLFSWVSVDSMFTKFIWDTFGKHLFFTLMRCWICTLNCFLLINLQWQFGYRSCFIRNHLLVYIRLVLGYAYIWDSWDFLEDSSAFTATALLYYLAGLLGSSFAVTAPCHYMHSLLR